MLYHRSYDPDEVEPYEYMRREAWFNFAELDWVMDEYGYDETTPFFEWRSFARDTVEPYIGLSRFDNRDAYCGASYFKLPAGQCYGLRLQRWQEQREAQRPVLTCVNIDNIEPF